MLVLGIEKKGRAFLKVHSFEMQQKSPVLNLLLEPRNLNYLRPDNFYSLSGFSSVVEKFVWRFGWITLASKT